MSAIAAWWLAVVAVPLVGALGIVLTRGRGAWWLGLTTAPALAAVGWAPRGAGELYPWLLLGCRLGLDELGAVFLGFTAAVWLFALLFAAGYVTSHRVAFFSSMLLAMAGNFGLILARDMPSFYLFFALMSFASYGMVVHRRDDAVRYAAKVYIVLVVVGEVLVFSGMIGLASLGNDVVFEHLPVDWIAHPLAPAIIGALVVGFGIKAGALPLHVWLPLAHPAAPAPASAVLSGAMIKAGLLGWLRFLPVGRAALPDWGEALVIAGLAASLYAVVFGCFQDQPKTILAYSSISKMGLLTALVGVALLQPDQAPAAVGAVGLFALDHALTKGALFLGSSIHPGHCPGRWRRGLITLGLAVPALGLAGFAATGGSVAKAALKAPFDGYAGLVPAEWMSSLLLAASLGAVLLAGRFLWVHLRQPAPHAPGALSYWAWALQTLVVLALPAGYLWLGEAKTVAKALTAPAIASAAWPVLVLVAGLAALWRFRETLRPVPRLPAGDLLVLYQAILRGIAAGLRGAGQTAQRLVPARALDRLRTAVASSVQADSVLRVEDAMGRFGVFGGLFLTVLAVFVLALLAWGRA